MIDLVFDQAREILIADLDQSFSHLKVFASKIFMLSVMDFEDLGDDDRQKFGTEVFDPFSNHMVHINERLRANKFYDQQIHEFINIGEVLFYRVFLFKLNLENSVLEEIINEPSATRNLRMKNIIAKSIVKYLEKDQLLFNSVCRNMSDFLSCFNFNSTVYTEMYYLNLLNFSLAPDILHQKIREIFPNADVFESCFSNANNDSNDDEWDIKRILSTFFPKLHQIEPDNQPLNMIKLILEEINPDINNIEVLADTIARNLFSDTKLFLENHRINAIVHSFRDQHDLCSAPLSRASLKIKIINRGNENYLLPKNFTHNISPFGYQNSSRCSFDRLVLFGRFNGDCLQNDIFLSDSCSDQEVIIITDEDGYHIADYSNEGLVAKNLPNNEDYEVKSGTIFRLENVFILIKNIFHDDQSKYIEMIVLKGGLYPNEIIRGKLNQECSKISLGRTGNVKINEKPTKVDGQDVYLIGREHCYFVLKNNNVFLNSIKGKKTWVNLKNREQFENGNPSDFNRIRDGDIISIKELEIIFKPYIPS